jgi:hypothetical protein
MVMVQISKIGRYFSGAFLIWLAFCSTALGDQQPPPVAQQVTLGWVASADPTVVGYYLYYGTTSGVYANKINVGTNTEFALSGLIAGSTYYFTTTSYNGAGVESGYVPQVSYIVPGMLTVTQSLTNGITRLQFPVAIGQSCQLQASADLESWSNLWLTPIQTTNQWIEYDEPITNTVPGRFYRLIFY